MLSQLIVYAVLAVSYGLGGLPWLVGIGLAMILNTQLAIMENQKKVWEATQC